MDRNPRPEPTRASAQAAARTSDSTRTTPSSAHSLRSPASPGTTTSVRSTPASSTSCGTLATAGGRWRRPSVDWRLAKTVTSWPRRRRAPSDACVAMTSRNMTSASGSVTATTAVLVPPMSTPTTIRSLIGSLPARLTFDCLLFLRRACVVVDQGNRGVKGVGEIERAELAGNRHGPAVVRRRLGGSAQDIDDMDIMVEVGRGRASGGQRHHRLPEPVGPVPGWIPAGVTAPVTPLRPEDLDAGGVPVVPEQVGGTLRSVELHSRPAGRPDRMAGHDRGQSAAAVPQDEVDDVRVDVAERRAAYLAGDPRGALYGTRFDHRAQQGREGLDVVDREVTEGTDVAGVVPRGPVGARVAIHGPSGVDLPGDARGEHCPQEPDRGRHLDERRHHEQPVMHLRQAGQAAGCRRLECQGFLDHDMLAPCQRSTG